MTRTDRARLAAPAGSGSYVVMSHATKTYSSRRGGPRSRGEVRPVLRPERGPSSPGLRGLRTGHAGIASVGRMAAEAEPQPRTPAPRPTPYCAVARGDELTGRGNAAKTALRLRDYA